MDFVFIDEVESFPLTVNPQAVLGTLGEIAEVCQDFFDSIQTAFGNSPTASTTVALASPNAFTLPRCVPRPPSMIAPA